MFFWLFLSLVCYVMIGCCLMCVVVSVCFVCCRRLRVMIGFLLCGLYVIVFVWNVRLLLIFL